MKKIKFYVWAEIVLITILLFFSAESKENIRRGVDNLKTAHNCYVYIALDSAQCFMIYKMDRESGELNFVDQVDAGGSTGALAVDPTHSFLYAAIRSENSISSFRIDPETGDLSLLCTIRAAGNPVYLSTDRTGKYLLSAYFADSKAAVYAIGKYGIIKDSAVQILETEKNAHAIKTDFSNRYAFVPCRTGETIHQYKFDSLTGLLTPNTTDCVVTDTLTGPRHIVFHPRLNVAYFSNEFSSTVSSYHFNTENGTLSPFQSLTMLPLDFNGRNKAADIHLTPDNRFLYATNRGHESIAGYSVDSLSGRLIPIGIFATEKTPREFDIDPSGRFLYAGGQGSGKLAAYRIDKETGRLTLFQTYEVGKYPAWVLIVTVGLE